jgi:hypothetical protein
VWHVVRMGEMINAYILIGKPEGKTQRGSSRRRWRVILDWILEK